MIPLSRMLARVDLAREDSDTALFYDLLNLGELVLKLIVAGMVSAVQDERERHRYRIEYGLVRASGIGDWATALDDVVTGPASQFLADEARPFQKELTLRWGPDDDAWQWRAVTLLEDAVGLIDPAAKQRIGRAQLRSWAHRFVWLRNRTRGHGAVTGDCCSAIAVPLEASIRAIIDNFALFDRSWAVLRRNLSGKYRVVPFAGEPAPFNHLKSTADTALENGAYIHLGQPRRVSLMQSDVDLSDFFLANGGYNDSRYELISYISDEHRYVDAAAFTAPPAPLPASATEGRPRLDLVGNCFTNLPPLPSGYVSRLDLENELRERLLDERHPIVTLVGLGGIGKTSLALEVLHSLAAKGRFFSIVWFSARDIDLLPDGPKSVRPQVLAKEEMADEYARLMQPSGVGTKGFNTEAFLTSSLSNSETDARQLFVFDNFETVRSPVDLYRWLDNSIRLPNKVLITTRMRQFKADYPVEVKGMTEPEFDALIDSVSLKLSIASLITAQYRRELYQESNGHPYVGKVLLGEAAREGKTGVVQRIMARNEDILEALFERTYMELQPTAQRVFLTLCSWRSAVPALALEAVLTRPSNERMDVGHAIEVLAQSSLIDIVISDEDGGEFLIVPLAAYLFGKEKLAVSPMRSAIEADTEVMRFFGAAQSTDVRHGVGPRVDRLFAFIAGQVQANPNALTEMLPVVEFVASKYPLAWLNLAKLYTEYDQLGLALDVLRRYLQKRPSDVDAWRILAGLSRQTGDYVSEMNALCSLAELAQTPYGEISDAANRFNAMVHDQQLDVATDERRVMAEKLRRLLEGRVGEADATDLSRLAWLCVNLRDQAAADHFAELGLERDPGNYYCQKLLARGY
jgi:hypothetical protein